jgi:hypothetical protein
MDKNLLLKEFTFKANDLISMLKTNLKKTNELKQEDINLSIKFIQQSIENFKESIKKT